MDNKNNNSRAEKPEDFRTAARWLSRGLEELLLEDERKSEQEKQEIAYDIVIVGSGYGGALAAAELAGGTDSKSKNKARICVLERGREYLAGMFPGSESDLPGALTVNTRHSPDPFGAPDGVVDLRLGRDVSVLLASGLGGGSLINAGVMEKAEPWVFDKPCWPLALRKPHEMDDWYVAAQEMLAPNKDGKFNQPRTALKQEAFFRLYPRGRSTRPNLHLEAPRSVDSYIPVKDGENPAGVPLKECTRCGDCMTGCNHRAKNSLDQNALVKARRLGADIVCGATVMQVMRASTPENETCWDLSILHTDPLLRRRQASPFRLRARRIILAAGTIGSTEILLRSRSSDLVFSSALGERFSANGDLICASFGEKQTVNAVADETQEFKERNIGPTTTSMMRAGVGENQIVVQEFAIPGPLRRLFGEGFTTSHLFHRLASCDPDCFHWPRHGGSDPYAVNRDSIDRTQSLGVMGHDGAEGRLVLRRRRNKDKRADLSHFPLQEKGVEIRWPGLKQAGGLFDAQIETLSTLVKRSGNGGTLLSNPFWQLLPKKLTSILDIKRGAALTTHPLGGCAMADTVRDGVVNEFGQVFDTRSATSVHPGLIVLDGSIIPRSLGINPAFTIAAIVMRALATLRKEYQTDALRQPVVDILPMPSFKIPRPAADIPTQIAIHERLVGDLHLVSDASEESEYTLELTLQFVPTSARDLATYMDRSIEVSEKNSVIRIFKRAELRDLRDRGDSEFRCDHRAAFVARLGGTVRLMDREWSTKPGRVVRGLYAWFRNRGKRDVWNTLVGSLSGKKKGGIRDLIPPGMLSVASHAGEVRIFDYDLKVGDEIPMSPLDSQLSQIMRPQRDRGRKVIASGTRIRGVKRFSYQHASNPWRQLSDVKLTCFPGLDGSVDTVLELETRHFARDQKHLFEIVKQRDGVTGLMDLFSFLLFTMRLVAAVHLWSFRKPDAPSANVPDRLPGDIPGMRPPTVTSLRVTSCDEKTRETRRVRVRLARYRKDGAKMPVLLVHGFSASGTTFAHPALRPGLARYLHDEGRDVWVVDLRTSAGMPTSKRAWSFEQIAREDIPPVFDHIRRETGAEKIDVVAHCMGAAMICMALLDPGKNVVAPHVRNLVLSQVGPMVSFTPANVFRAYCVSYIQHIFRESNFSFRAKPGNTNNFLDRLLATLPYPRDEFAFENPEQPCARTPYAMTRHRMDAWFGRVFNVANMDAAVLECIDDFFGSVNLRTSFQTLHFARNSMITTRRGTNQFVVPGQLERLKKMRLLSIHGAKNGLADPATLVRMQIMTKEMGIPFRAWLLPEFGHQDCIMGRDAVRLVFPGIRDFLNFEQSAPSPNVETRYETPKSIAVMPMDTVSGQTQVRFTAQPPFMGPLVGMPNDSGKVVAAVASDPKYTKPTFAISIAADLITEEWRVDILQKIRNHEHPWVEHKLDTNLPGDPPIWNTVVAQLADEATPASFVVLLIYNMPAIVPGNWSQPAGYLVTSKDADGPEPRIACPGLDHLGEAIQLINRRDAIEEALELLLLTTPLESLRLAQVVLPSRRIADANTLRFAVASCQYPAGPLDPGIATASYARLGKLLDDAATRPRCILLVGDQIYADATAGVFDPSLLDGRYDLPYEDWLRACEVRNVLRRAPLYAMLDDHEIDNNWEPNLIPADKSRQRRKMGVEAYFRVQRAAGPPCTSANGSEHVPAWYRANIDGFDFFFCDTRSEREKRTVKRLHTREIMRNEQFDALKQWLTGTSTSRPRFVISGSMLLPRRKLARYGEAGALQSDAWEGYPASFRRLLAFIANRKLTDLVFLSGDEHHSCIATVRLFALDKDKQKTGDLAVFHSIHSSALNAPFPFANGEPADLEGEDWFTFENPEHSSEFPAPLIGCSVTTHFVEKPGDGFAVLDCLRGPKGEGWQVRCDFSRPPADNGDADRDEVYRFGRDSTARLEQAAFGR